MATLEIPSLGYGIRYEFGIFAQDIVDGEQVELTDKWLCFGNPWDLPRPEWAVEVHLGGHTHHYSDRVGGNRAQWLPALTVMDTPYDTAILGYRNHTANTLRLWRAEAPEAFDLSTFNRGDYWGAVNKKVISENITKVLYPNDEQIQGKELRLQQQYFLVACSLKDMMRIMRHQGIPLDRFHAKFAVQVKRIHENKRQHLNVLHIVTLYHRLKNDPDLLLADYQSHVDCQGEVDQAYRDKERWARMAILNVARSGKRSSDRTIRDYCREIWQVEPKPVMVSSRDDMRLDLGKHI